MLLTICGFSHDAFFRREIEALWAVVFGDALMLTICPGVACAKPSGSLIVLVG